MIELERGERERKSKKKRLRVGSKSELISFMPSKDIRYLLLNLPVETGGFNVGRIKYKNRTEFLNESIKRNLMIINNPKQFLINLKQQMPKLWRYVNRLRVV